MKIPADQWATVSRLLDEALDLDAGARPTWLERLTAREPQVGAVVKRLLATHADRETVDVMAALPRLHLPVAPAVPASALALGERVGPYRLLRELGTGGMAHVWLARRDDGAFTREVALKIPQLSRLRRDLAERFARERDILARLEHPNIARLYDAGVSADGLPYLAMEYVDGQPITPWCDSRRLDITQRLHLFRQVLDAVQFAHSNLVIHRDLKPSNILVTADGQVRLLDFGIAKLLADDDSTRETQLTQLSGRALTPDYASPEQIKGEPLTIASDVYSLGVVLYELLAGQRPYKLKLQSAAQLELAIIDAEVSPPSTRIDSPSAASRNTPTNRLARQIAGDLDAIVLKALARIPVDRYTTMAAFADDLDRYRDARPVSAQTPSRWYRLQKLVARNKFNAGIGAALAVTLLIATVVSLAQAQRAREQAAAALRESRRAEAVTRFVTNLFEANSLDSVQASRRRQLTAEQLLEEGAARISIELAGEPALKVELQQVVGRLLHGLSMTEKALDVRQDRLRSINQSSVTSAVRAGALQDVAESLEQKGEMVKARAHYEQAIALLQASSEPADARLHWSLVSIAGYLDMVAGDSRHGAERIAQAAGALRRIAPQSLEHGEALIRLGEAHSKENRTEESIPMLNEGLIIAEQALGPRSIRLARHQIRIGLAMHSQRRFAQAEGYFRQALRTMDEIAGPSHPATAIVKLHLGRLLSILGRPNEARQYLAPAAAVLAVRKSDIDPTDAADALMFLGEALLDEGRVGAAGSPIMDAMARYGDQTDTTSLTVAQATYARYLLDTGQYAQALDVLRQAREKRMSAFGPDHPAVASLTNRIGIVHMAAGEWLEAGRTFRTVEDSQQARESVFGSPRHLAALNLAALDIERRRFAEALPVVRESLAMFEVLPESAHSHASDFALRVRMARALIGVGRAAEARPHIERANAIAAELYEHGPSRITMRTVNARYLAAIGDTSRARDELRLARQSLAAHSALGPQFHRTVQAAERDLGLPTTR